MAWKSSCEAGKVPSRVLVRHLHKIELYHSWSVLYFRPGRSPELKNGEVSTLCLVKFSPEGYTSFQTAGFVLLAQNTWSAGVLGVMYSHAGSQESAGLAQCCHLRPLQTLQTVLKRRPLLRLVLPAVLHQLVPASREIQRFSSEVVFYSHEVWGYTWMDWFGQYY